MSKKWMRGIWGKKDSIKTVRFQRGYTKTAMIIDVDKIDIGPCPYEGWEGKYIRLFLGNKGHTV